MTTFSETYFVFKHLPALFIFGLSYSGYTQAQQLNSAEISVMSGTPAEMRQDSPFVYPPAMHNQFIPSVGGHNYGNHYNRPSHGGPVVVLPMPVPMGGNPGFKGTQGFQYPGSYMPRDTPLHRFNGYVVCDPPNLPTETAAGTTARAAQRVVKTTSTRSLAAPSHSQPCPVYTINGEIAGKTSNTMATSPPVRQHPK